MREPSASQGQLAEYCGHPFTAWTRLPFDANVAGADLGKVVHAGAEAAVRGEDTCLHQADLSPEDAIRATRMADRIREFLAEETHVWREAEVILAYNVNDGIARLKSSRFAPREHGERTAIIDMVASLGHGKGLVVDWKTGRQQYIKEAEHSWQLALGALAAADYYRFDEMRVEYRYVDEAEVSIDGAWLDAWALATWAERFREQRRRLTQGPMPPTPGWWCTGLYCPLRGHCDATKQALATLAPPDHPAIAEMGDVQLEPLRTEEEVRRVLLNLPRAEAVLKQYQSVVRLRKEEAKAWALRGGVSLGNGKRAVVREQKNRDVRIERPEHVEALRQVLGDDGVKAAVEVKTVYEATGATIKEGARIAAQGMKRGALGKIHDAAMGALAEVGAIKTSTYTKLDEIDDVQLGENNE